MFVIHRLQETAMTSPPIASTAIRYPAPELTDLPEDIRAAEQVAGRIP